MARVSRGLQAHAKQITAPYKYPRQVTFVDRLPKTVSGKIQRNLLRRSAGVSANLENFGLGGDVRTS